MSDTPKRGWLTISIREILLVTLIVAMLVGWGAQTYLRKWPTAKEKALMQERLEALRKVVDHQQQMLSRGFGNPQALYDAQDALTAAELELSTTFKERQAVLEKNLAVYQQHENITSARYKTGAVADTEMFTATAGRIKAEIAMERAKAGR
jgi:hypothetical protein